MHKFSLAWDRLAGVRDQEISVVDHSAWVTISTALIPPKANELDKAA